MQENQNQVVKYTVTDAKLAEMKDQLTGLEEYNDLKEGIARCRIKRVEVENEKKSLNEDALRHQRAVNAEAKRIIETLFEIENPLKEKKKVIDDEKDRIKQEKIDKAKKRIADIEVKIDAIKAFDTEALRCNGSDEMKKVYEYVDGIEVDDSFEELQGRAINAKTECLLSIATTIAAKEEQEVKAEKDLAEEKRLRIEQEEIVRVNRAEAEELRIKNEKVAEENRIAKEENDKLAADLAAANEKIQAEKQKVIDAEKEAEALKLSEEKRKQDEANAIVAKEEREAIEKERLEKLEAIKPDVEKARDAVQRIVSVMMSSLAGNRFETHAMGVHFVKVVDESMEPLNKFLEETKDMA